MKLICATTLVLLFCTLMTEFGASIQRTDSVESDEYYLPVTADDASTTCLSLQTTIWCFLLWEVTVPGDYNRPICIYVYSSM